VRGIADRLAVTAAAYDTVSARHAEFVRGDLDALSPAMIEIARARYPGIRFGTASMHALPLADGALAGIVSWYPVIHAVPGDLRACFAEFARVLKPGGYLLVCSRRCLNFVRVAAFGGSFSLSKPLRRVAGSTTIS
jgi:SAM-dependent methyltransferase